jgi:hypothetical protein
VDHAKAGVAVKRSSWLIGLAILTAILAAGHTLTLLMAPIDGHDAGVHLTWLSGYTQVYGIRFLVSALDTECVSWAWSTYLRPLSALHLHPWGDSQLHLGSIIANVTLQNRCAPWVSW